MQRFILVLLLFVGACDPCTCPNASAQTIGPKRYEPFDPFGHPANDSHLSKKVDGHDRYNIGRETPFPLSGDKLYFVVVMSDAWERDPTQVRLAQWLTHDPRLVKAKASTIFYYVTESDPHFKSTLKHDYGINYPIVVIQDDTRVLNQGKLERSNFPNTSGELADWVDSAVDRHMSDCNPKPQPNVTPPNNDGGFVVPPAPPLNSSPDAQTILLAGGAIVAAGAGMYSQKMKSDASKPTKIF